MSNGGVDLRALLNRLGVRREATHVWAYGLDCGSFIDVEQAHYLKDIPRSRVDEGDVLIAYELNGEPLSAKHGAPARLIVPGYYGTNCVKWLCRLELQDRRADSLFTNPLYNDRDLDRDPSGHTTKPVWMVEPESLIASPTADATLADSPCEIWVGRGRTVLFNLWKLAPMADMCGRKPCSNPAVSTHGRSFALSGVLLDMGHLSSVLEPLT